MTDDLWEPRDFVLRVELGNAMDHLDAQTYATRAWCEAAEVALTAYDACLEHADLKAHPTPHRRTHP